jgi:xanthine dehydrogenase accessory factor
MDSVDYSVLNKALDWQHEPALWLATVIRTYGSSSRPVGSMLLINAHGLFVGSVSGGCIEDDIVDKVKSGELSTTKVTQLSYGGSREEGERLGLPCGGTIELLMEPIVDFSWVTQCLQHIREHRLMVRTLDIETLAVRIEATSNQSQLSFDGRELKTIFGPVWRLLIIGAGQTSTYLAEMALALNFAVVVCDPRAELAGLWTVANTKLISEMPDDAVLSQRVDARTAVVAISHDLKLDDMALLEALKSPAFYVGALGSILNNKKRRERLALFDLTADEIARLHGPIGIDIHSKTPPEIAISILAHIISIKNQLSSARGLPAVDAEDICYS